MSDRLRQQAVHDRTEALDDANANLAISGGYLSAQAARLAARVVAGELTDEDAIAELLRQHS